MPEQTEFCSGSIFARRQYTVGKGAEDMTGKSTGIEARTIIRATGSGALTSFLILMVMTGILAMLVNREILPQDAIRYGVLGILLVSSFAGGMVAKGKGSAYRFLLCASSALGFFLILLGIQLLFFDGIFAGMAQKALLILAGSGAAGLAGSRRSRSRGVRKGGRSSKVVQKSRRGKY